MQPKKQAISVKGELALSQRPRKDYILIKNNGAARTAPAPWSVSEETINDLKHQTNNQPGDNIIDHIPPPFSPRSIKDVSSASYQLKFDSGSAQTII